MSFSLGAYRGRMPEIERYCKQQVEKGKKIHELPHLVTGYTGIPIIVSCHFVEELFGKTEQLTALADKIMKFYRYDSIRE